MINIYTWKLKEGESELIEKIMLSTFGDNKEVPKYRVVELEDGPIAKPIDSVILCFGIRAFNMVSFEYPTAIKLPALSELLPLPENRESRMQAWEILTQARKAEKITHTDLDLELKPEDLAENLTEKSKTLVRQIEENKTEYWVGTTTLGKKVLISNQPNTKNIPCNFQLTFEELYAAKLAFDLLGLKSLTLVKGKEDDQG